MLLIIKIVKYGLIGICLGILVFASLGVKHYYSEELLNPIENEMYIEVFNLYKKNIIENILWTSASQRIFSPDTMTVYITTDFKHPEGLDAFSEYKPMDASYPMYLVAYGNQIFSLRFKRYLEIRVWQ